MSIKSVLKNSLDKMGYEVKNLRNVPPFMLGEGESVLKPRLEFLLSYQYLLKGDQFCFIQIGAYDGLANDPLAWFVEKTRCRGILIEPQLRPFNQLKERYADRPEIIPLNVAIGESTTEMEFYSLKLGSQDLPPWAEQISSLRKDVLLSHKNVISNIEELIQSSKVACLSMSALYNQYNIRELDLLQIDTEGYDAVIIKSLDFNQLRPAIIHYEHKHFSYAEINDCTDLLVKQGYQLFMQNEDTTAFLSSRNS